VCVCFYTDDVYYYGICIGIARNILSSPRREPTRRQSEPVCSFSLRSFSSSSSSSSVVVVVRVVTGRGAVVGANTSRAGREIFQARRRRFHVFDVVQLNGEIEDSAVGVSEDGDFDRVADDVVV